NGNDELIGRVSPGSRSSPAQSPASVDQSGSRWTSRSRDEQHLARRLPALERAVSFGGILQRVLQLHPETELAVSDPAEDFAGAALEIVTRGDVMVETGACEVKRALGVEHLRIDLADRPARLTVERHEAARGEAREALVPRRLADAVVDHLQALATSDALDLGFEILARVVDPHVRAGIARELRLLFARDGADHAGPAHLRDLAEQQPDTAGRGVDKRRVPFAQVVRRAREIVGRRALEHGCGT